MNYLLHGYIDIFNHEINYNSLKKLKLVTNTNDIIFEDNGHYNYNSKDFLDKILQHVLLDLKKRNNNLKKIRINKSLLRFSPDKQPHAGGTYNEHVINLKIHPFDDMAHIIFDELSLISYFRNEFSFVEKVYIKSKTYTFDETQSKLIILPQHCLQVSLEGCKNYTSFKSTILDAIYKDITFLIIEELKKVTIPKWNISLKENALDFEGIIKDNFKLIAA
jgi:hypothetical protein